MLIPMTSQNIQFDEKAFIQSILDRHNNDEIAYEPYEEIFDNYYRLTFPTNEYSEFIRTTYYSGENYNSTSLYYILSNKLDDALFDEDDSHADTEEEFHQDVFEGEDYD